MATRYEDRSKDELVELARERGVSTGGTKAELVARLRGESVEDGGDEPSGTNVVDHGPTDTEQYPAGTTQAAVTGADEETIKQRLAEKFNAGNYTLFEDEAQAVADALGFGDEVNIGVTFEGGEGSPMAGLTPATGSGGVPSDPENATEETKEAVEAAQDRLDEDDYGDGPDAALRKQRDRRLARSLG